VIDEGDKGGAADGLESDADGSLYAINDEHNAILRRRPSGDWETLVHDPRQKPCSLFRVRVNAQPAPPR